MQYPKINTIWKRDETNKYIIIEDDYSKEEFKNIKNWNISEKIDGTNIRIECFFEYMHGGEIDVVFKGRTDNAEIPKFLLGYLEKAFTKEIILPIFKEKQPGKVILYGEGYGPKIQKGGGNYRDDAGFILFAVWIDGWWLDRDKVKEIATMLDIKVVPEIGIMTIDDAVKYIKGMPKSIIAEKECLMEGVVARSYPLMLFRDKSPIMWKLKVEDFMKLKRFGKDVV